jgi:phage regulator Rha-like protein
MGSLSTTTAPKTVAPVKVTELKLVEVRGHKLTTTSEIIANSCGVRHETVIKLTRKFKNDLSDVGLVRFEIRLNTQGSRTEIAVLDDYSAMLLLTHMRSSVIVSKFKKALVQEFKRIKQILNEPGRKVELQYKRDTAREMTDAVKFVRELQGKASNQNHYINEYLFCNRALTGRWQPIIESELDSYDLRLLAAIRTHNALLMGLYPKQADRKAPLDNFVANYKVKHPRQVALVGG